MISYETKIPQNATAIKKKLPFIANFYSTRFVKNYGLCGMSGMGNRTHGISWVKKSEVVPIN
jgi:hypothetical protein